MGVTTRRRQRNARYRPAHPGGRAGQELPHHHEATAPASPRPTDRRARARRLLRDHFSPLALYAALTVLVTYPLVLQFGARVPSDGGDALQNYWNYWWLREALFAGRNPYWTPLLYAPDGVPLYLHTLNPFNGLATLPLQLLFGDTIAYNAVILLSFTMAGYFAYLLVAHVSGSRAAGLAGGVIYAFGSYHLARVVGHMNLLASEWLPAYILCLLRANETLGRRRAVYTAAAVGALTLALLCDWQYVLYALLFTALYTLWQAVARRSPAPVVIALAIGAGWAILAAPLLVPTALQIGRGGAAASTPAQVRGYSADLLSFVLPTDARSWWGRAVERAVVAKPVTSASGQHSNFLGYLPLALALLALRWDRRRAAFWALAGLAFAILALGPYLHVHGAWRFGAGSAAGGTGGAAGGAGWSVPLPYLVLQRVPGLGIIRVPSRFSLMVTLCLAVLAGLALAQLAQRFPATRRPRLRLALLTLLLAALVGEHLALPVPTEAVSPPPFYQALAGSDEAGAIFEVPFCKECLRSRALYFQTVHRRPIVGGYISRKLPYPVRELPPLRTPPDPAADIVAQVPSPELGLWALRYSGVRWIAVYLDDPAYDPAETDAFLARYAEPAPLYRDERMAVYRPLAPHEPASHLEVEGGCYDAERSAGGGGRFRWCGQAATLRAWHFGPAPQAYELRLAAWGFGRPRQVEVSVDGRVVGQWMIAATRGVEGAAPPLSVPLTLDQGPHTIALRSLEPATSPAAADPASRDGRQLAFALAGLELRPAP